MIDLKNLIETALRYRNVRISKVGEIGENYVSMHNKLSRPELIRFYYVERILHKLNLRLKISVVTEDGVEVYTCTSDPKAPIITEERRAIVENSMSNQMNLPCIRKNRKEIAKEIAKNGDPIAPSKKRGRPPKNAENAEK